MLMDARSLAAGATIEADICIVGAGAAGITIARELAGSSLRVVLLEGGGEEIAIDSQSLYEGENVGLPYYTLDTCRLRYFGGSTNHWGGHCMPYRPSDLVARDDIPHSGWPIGHADVEPYFAKAAEIVAAPRGGWDVAHWEEATGKRRLPLDPYLFVTRVHTVWQNLFGTVHRPALESAPNAQVYLNANVTEIEVEPNASHVTGLRVRAGLGPELAVRASRYVLAAGGIENARLLLLSNSVQAEGLGNGHDLVGRFFTDDCSFKVGTIVPTDPAVAIGFYYKQPIEGGRLFAHLALSEAAQRRECICPVTFALLPRPEPEYVSDAGVSFRSLGRDIRNFRFPADLGRHVANIAGDLGSLAELAIDTARYGQVPIETIDVAVAMIPAPNPESRVLLSDRRDALGLRQVDLDFRLTPLDKRTVCRSTELLAAEIARAGIGRMRTVVDDGPHWPDDLKGNFHHLSTTRMSDSPSRGVVDADCKVHGIDNLWIAGSSVFPASGAGTPTFMLVALALRLADHLKERHA
jgi:choline dehydrogenase-like flavoprotein